MTGTMAFHKDISAIATKCFSEKEDAKKFAAMIKVASESLTEKEQDLLFVKEVIDDAAQLLKEQGVSEMMLARGRIAMIYTELAQSINADKPDYLKILDDIEERQKNVLLGWNNEQKIPNNEETPNNTTTGLEKAYERRLRGPGVFSV